VISVCGEQVESSARQIAYASSSYVESGKIKERIYSIPLSNLQDWGGMCCEDILFEESMKKGVESILKGKTKSM
jgi:hypothetical protein